MKYVEHAAVRGSIDEFEAIKQFLRIGGRKLAQVCDSEACVITGDAGSHSWQVPHCLVASDLLPPTSRAGHGNWK